jgi:hypothetical protein
MNKMKWKPLNEKSIETLKEVAGVYWIRSNMKIKRLFGVDNQGLLMIGASKNLHDRIWAFYVASTGQRKSMQHIEGQRYHYFKIRKLHKGELEFKYQKTKNKKEAFAKENMLLEQYEIRHKELPPLNKTGGWKGV